ncbi:MAG TPA: hypothetical protein VK631_21645 [Solirubrobacteraceae bacterium]|nr:hypothetical protein [Solirubrobacteraceae bacterium]
MNRASDPDLADSLSGAALGPCSHPEAGAAPGAGSDGAIPPLPSAPADLPLVGLHRELVFATAAISPLVAHLGDLARNRRTTVEMCWWLDELRSRAADLESHAKALRHMCDVLWEMSYQEGVRRRAHHEPARGAADHVADGLALRANGTEF